MKLDIDVSGEDILTKNYSICIANKDVIVGFKFDESLISILKSRFGQGFYRYSNSRRQSSLFKVRLYSIIVYYLLESIKVPEYDLTICRDFNGNEDKIKDNLNYFIKDKLKKQLKIHFRTLESDSNAHNYAYKMRTDYANKLSIYHTIKIEQMEKYLK